MPCYTALGFCYAALFPPEIIPAANLAVYVGIDIAKLHQFGERSAVLTDEIVQSVPEYLRFAATDRVLDDLLAPSPLQSITLQVKILLRCRNSRIADDHTSPPWRSS